MEGTLDVELVKRAVNFHGQQLQKIWESEQSTGDLVKSGNIEFDFSVYQERQKHLSFQDRGKRLKVQHFIARNAEQLFDTSNINRSNLLSGKPLAPGEEDYYAVLPPYDKFLPLDKAGRLKHFYECIMPGELLICSITSKSSSGMMLKVLCTDSIPFRYVQDLNVKAFCPASQMPPGGVVTDKKGISRAVMLNEAIRVELLEVVPDTEKMVVSMLQSRPTNSDDATNEAAPSLNQLGLVYTEDLPVAYKRCQEHKSETYSELLERSLGFANPSNTELLASRANIGQGTSTSMLKSLRGRFPVEEYAQEVRQVQASKWAFKSVAEGITHFKAGRHSEAFQCLNRALSIDRRNVEGLVARGALYANSGSFQKAIEDFETALKLNTNHQNARKYMGETLVALGRSYEDENKLEEAMKAYEDCLELVPYHEEAKSSIRYLESKMHTGGNNTAAASKMSSDPHAINPSSAPTDGLIPGAISSLSDALMPGLSSTKSMEVKATLKQLLKAEQEEKGRSSHGKKKKDRKRKSRHRSRKRRHRSSSTSSSSSTASASSSSSSSSSSGSGSSGERGSSRSGSGSPHRGSSKRRKSKKHMSKDSHREKSLSPLSKRMAMMETSRDSDGLAGLMTQRMSQYNSASLPYSFDDSAPLAKVAGLVPPASNKESEYEMRVRAFLEQTKGDSDYEEKVRKFLEESAKWKKEKKAQEKDGKKKKKKDKSKSRDKDKGKKKKSKEEDKRRKRRSRKSALSELAGELGDGSGLAEQLEGLDESGRRLVKEALLQKLGKPRHRTVVEGSESSSDEHEGSGGMAFSALKKQQHKTAELRADRGQRKLKGARQESRMLGEMPDLGDLESKLSAYYAKIEKDKGMSKREDKEKKSSITRSMVSYPSPIGKPPKSSNNNAGGGLSPKMQYMHHLELDDDIAEKRSRMDIFADSPSPSSKKLGQSANIVSSKWKMQITPSNSKVKRREQNDKEPWEEVEDKRFIFMKEGREEGEASSGGDEGISSARHRPPTPKHKFNAKESYFEKFTGFRIARKDDPTKMDPSAILPSKAPPTPVPAPGKDGSNAKGLKSDSEAEADPKKLAKIKSRSRSKSTTSRSRGRSSGSSASRKRRRRSHSGSYRRRSRSGSYRYRSRSRSGGSYYRSSRSRSRSRSYIRSRSRSYDSRSRSGSHEGRRRSSDYYRRGSRSPDRYRRYDGRGNAHRYPRQRGTYYRPRFQSYKSPRGGYVPRGRGYNPRGGRPFIHRGRGRGRPRYFHYNRPGGGYRPDHHRRYSDSRERSRNSEERRSYDGDRDRDREESERARDRDRERMRREEEHKSDDGGSKREREIEEEESHHNDDYAPPLPPPKQPSDYIDRKMFEGKWGEERDEEKRRSERRALEDIPPPPGTGEPLPENSIEEMDKFLNKVKAQKKEEMRERNKTFTKYK